MLRCKYLSHLKTLRVKLLGTILCWLTSNLFQSRIYGYLSSVVTRGSGPKITAENNSEEQIYEFFA